MDLSWDGRLCVTSHADGTVCVWDVVCGSKVRVIDKHRGAPYAQVALVCDRLGAFASGSSATDSPLVKHEKFSLPRCVFVVLLDVFVEMCECIVFVNVVRTGQLFVGDTLNMISSARLAL